MISRIATFTGIALLKLVAYAPMKFLYLVSDLIFLLVYHIFRYRRQVVSTNLQRSFPDKNSDQLKSIETRYFRYMCDLMLESLKTWNLSATELSSRMVLRNPELMNALYEKGQSVLLLAMHYGNWEWLLHMPLQLKHHNYFVYKPLQNRRFDDFINATRRRFGGETISMSISLRKLLEAEKLKQPVLTWLAVDQSPPWNHPFWTTFMHQDTIFFNGPAKLAQRFNQPIVFQHVRRIKRGYYETWFELLVENPRELSEAAIVKTYVKKVEEVINAEPAFYLWSHRRWKYTKPENVVLH